MNIITKDEVGYYLWGTPTVKKIIERAIPLLLSGWQTVKHRRY